MQAAVARSETDEPHLPELSFINSAKKTDEDLKKFVLTGGKKKKKTTKKCTKGRTNDQRLMMEAICWSFGGGACAGATRKCRTDHVSHQFSPKFLQHQTPE